MALEDPDWLTRARCRGVSPNAFYPAGSGGQVVKRAHEVAKAFCRSCPVDTECLRLAMAAEQGLGEAGRWGVWGALDPAERAALETVVGAP